MSAREEILHLMNQYCFTIDTGDLDGFASLFEHGEWTIEGSKPGASKKAQNYPNSFPGFWPCEILLSQDVAAAKAENWGVQKLGKFPEPI